MSLGSKSNAGRSLRRLRVRSLGSLALVLAVGCDSEKVDSTEEGEQVCEPGETSACEGDEDCDGTQECLPDGSGFTECECETPPSGGDAGEGATDGGAAGRGASVPTGGASHGGESSGGAPSGGTTGQGGAPSGMGGFAPAGGRWGIGGREDGGSSGSGVVPGGSTGWGGEPPSGGPGWVSGGANDGGYGNPGGYGNTAGVAGAPSCLYTVSVAAELENEVATLSYTYQRVRYYDGDPNVSGYDDDDDRVDISIQHKLDVDVADGAGCIGAVSIVLRQHGGCSLRLDFGAGEDESALELWYATLQADSLCPNWSDADEGLYVWRPGNSSATLDLSEATAWVGYLPESCLSVPLQPSGTITLTRASDGRQITLDLSALSITGQMETMGSPTACCPGLDCRPQGYAGGPSVGTGGAAGRPAYAGAPGWAGAPAVAGAGFAQ